ncbi:MAG: hypothetical protein KDB33_19140 [Acidimicrobiales bacterium]|nr:hypothetical protein [Acidimicrobiales bacterium]
MATATRTPNRRLAWLLIIIGVVGGTITLLSLDRRTGTTVDVQLNVGCPSLIIYTDGDDRWWAGEEPVIDGPLRTEAERAADRLAPGTVTFEEDGSVTFRADAGGTVRLEPDPNEFHHLGCAIVDGAAP